MDGLHLSLLNHILLQLEAEELAGRLSDSFDDDFSKGLAQRIPDLVRAFRADNPYR